MKLETVLRPRPSETLRVTPEMAGCASKTLLTTDEIVKMVEEWDNSRRDRSAMNYILLLIGLIFVLVVGVPLHRASQHVQDR